VKISAGVINTSGLATENKKASNSSRCWVEGSYANLRRFSKSSVKAATVECMKCSTFHTSFFQLFKCIIRVFKVHFLFLEFSV
jgi:hypothetical protein